MVSDPKEQLFAGAIALGAVHGVEPGQGWPVVSAVVLVAMGLGFVAGLF